MKDSDLEYGAWERAHIDSPKKAEIREKFLTALVEYTTRERFNLRIDMNYSYPKRRHKHLEGNVIPDLETWIEDRSSNPPITEIRLREDYEVILISEPLKAHLEKAHLLADYLEDKVGIAVKITDSIHDKNWLLKEFAG